jgi:hypothetical protein
MNIYKKIFLFSSLIFLSNSYSHAAYFTPINIGDMNKYQDSRQVATQQRAHFWGEIKSSFSKNPHLIRAYMSIMNDLFRIVVKETIIEMSPVIKIFQNQLNGVFVEYKNPQTFFAYVLLEDMVLSSELFRNIENPHFKFKLDTFGASVKNIVCGSPNQLLVFCEIMIFLKNLDVILLDKNTESKKIDPNVLDKANKANKANKFLTDYDYALGIPKESAPLESIKNFWTQSNPNSWATTVYSLIEYFCVNSSKFRELQGY